MISEAPIRHISRLIAALRRAARETLIFLRILRPPGFYHKHHGQIGIVDYSMETVQGRNYLKLKPSKNPLDLDYLWRKNFGFESPVDFWDPLYLPSDAIPIYIEAANDLLLFEYCGVVEGRYEIGIGACAINIRTGAVSKATKLLRGPKESLNRDLPISFPTRVRSGDKNYILLETVSLGGTFLWELQPRPLTSTKNENTNVLNFNGETNQHNSVGGGGAFADLGVELVNVRKLAPGLFDPVLFEHHGEWYLFGTTIDYRQVWHKATSLFDPFVEINSGFGVSDPRLHRNGGGTCAYGESRLRVYQNCESEYGKFFGLQSMELSGDIWQPGETWSVNWESKPTWVNNKFHHFSPWSLEWGKKGKAFIDASYVWTTDSHGVSFTRF